MALQKDKQDEEHPTTALLYRLLAQAEYHNGKKIESRRHFYRALEIQQAKLPEGHSEISETIKLMEKFK